MFAKKGGDKDTKGHISASPSSSSLQVAPDTLLETVPRQTEDVIRTPNFLSLFRRRSKSSASSCGVIEAKISGIEKLDADVPNKGTSSKDEKDSQSLARRSLTEGSNIPSILISGLQKSKCPDDGSCSTITRNVSFSTINVSERSSRHQTPLISMTGKSNQISDSTDYQQSKDTNLESADESENFGFTSATQQSDIVMDRSGVSVDKKDNYQQQQHTKEDTNFSERSSRHQTPLIGMTGKSNQISDSTDNQQSKDTNLESADESENFGFTSATQQSDIVMDRSGVSVDKKDNYQQQQESADESFCVTSATQQSLNLVECPSRPVENKERCQQQHHKNLMPTQGTSNLTLEINSLHFLNTELELEISKSEAIASTNIVILQQKEVLQAEVARLKSIEDDYNNYKCNFVQISQSFTDQAKNLGAELLKVNADLLTLTEINAAIKLEYNLAHDETIMKHRDQLMALKEQIELTSIKYELLNLQNTNLESNFAQYQGEFEQKKLLIQSLTEKHLVSESKEVLYQSEVKKQAQDLKEFEEELAVKVRLFDDLQCTLEESEVKIEAQELLKAELCLTITRQKNESEDLLLRNFNLSLTLTENEKTLEMSKKQLLQYERQINSADCNLQDANLRINELYLEKTDKVSEREVMSLALALKTKDMIDLHQNMANLILKSTLQCSELCSLQLNFDKLLLENNSLEAESKAALNSQEILFQSTILSLYEKNVQLASEKDELQDSLTQSRNMMAASAHNQSEYSQKQALILSLTESNGIFESQQVLYQSGIDQKSQDLEEIKKELAVKVRLFDDLQFALEKSHVNNGAQGLVNAELSLTIERQTIENEDLLLRNLNLSLKLTEHEKMLEISQKEITDYAIMTKLTDCEHQEDNLHRNIVLSDLDPEKNDQVNETEVPSLSLSGTNGIFESQQVLYQSGIDQKSQDLEEIKKELAVKVRLFDDLQFALEKSHVNNGAQGLVNAELSLTIERQTIENEDLLLRNLNLSLKLTEHEKMDAAEMDVSKETLYHLQVNILEKEDLIKVLHAQVRDSSSKIVITESSLRLLTDTVIILKQNLVDLKRENELLNCKVDLESIPEEDPLSQARMLSSSKKSNLAIEASKFLLTFSIARDFVGLFNQNEAVAKYHYQKLATLMALISMLFMYKLI